MRAYLRPSEEFLDKFLVYRKGRMRNLPYKLPTATLLDGVDERITDVVAKLRPFEVRCGRIELHDGNAFGTYVRLYGPIAEVQERIAQAYGRTVEHFPFLTIDTIGFVHDEEMFEGITWTVPGVYLGDKGCKDFLSFNRNR